MGIEKYFSSGYGAISAATRFPPHLLTSLAVLALVSLTGCTNTYTVASATAGEKPTSLPRDARYYVAMPEDGAYGSEVYRGSGRDTGNAMATAIGGYAKNVEVGARTETLDEALQNASARGCDYVVYPAIVHWEDRATEWSGLPDRVRIRVTIMRCDSRATVDATNLEGKSKWATFGGDHPEDMLLPLFKNYIARHFE